MSNRLEREGIFKARPFKWEIKRAESGAVAISLGFEIVSQYDGSGGWVEWKSAGHNYHCYGDWWVIKKTGEVNIRPVDQLVLSLDWSGDLFDVKGDPPDVEVQIKVKAETYNGTTRYKATWMNPGDYEPSDLGATEEEVQQMSAQYGSLLRAAAAASKAPAQAAPPPAQDAPPHTDDDHHEPPFM